MTVMQNAPAAATKPEGRGRAVVASGVAAPGAVGWSGPHRGIAAIRSDRGVIREDGRRLALWWQGGLL